MEYVAERAPQAWKEAHAVPNEVPPFEPIPESQTVDQAAVKSAWARFLAKLYEDACSRRAQQYIHSPVSYAR